MIHPRRMGGYRALAGSFALLGTAAALLVVIASEVAAEPSHFWVSHFGTLAVVAGYFAVGAWAWLRRPGNAIGFLTVAAGFSLLMGVFSSSSVLTLEWIGGAFSVLTVALTAHVLLAFPEGRLGTAPARIAASAAYATAASFVVQVMLSDVAPSTRTSAATLVATLVLTASGVVFAVGSAWILIARLRRAAPSSRASLLPLYLYGAIAIVSVVYLPVLLPPSPLLYNAQLLVLFGVPVVLVMTTLRGRFSKLGEINSLGAALGASWEVPGDLSATLARIFGDPEARVVFWSQEQQCFLSYEGEALSAPPEFDATVKRPEDRLVRLTLRHQNVTVGAIFFRPLTVIDIALVQSAAQVLVLAVERAQLTVQLKANEGQLRESRLRVLTAADRERARIAQNLHDGAQAHLVLLTMEVGTFIGDLARSTQTQDATLARLARLRRDIDLAAGALRELVYDVMPPLLLERDLSDALEVLTDRNPIPTTLTVSPALRHRQHGLPGALLSTVYFVVSESLTNAMKHSGATAIDVDVRWQADQIEVLVSDNGAGGVESIVAGVGASGLGLRSMRDRVETLGGMLQLSDRARVMPMAASGGSAPVSFASGLCVRAVIPCAS